MTDRVRVRDVAAAVNAIMPILANHTAEVQGAALSELVALWLGGFRALEGAPEPIGTMRRKLGAALLDHALDRAPVMARNFGRSP
jgi:hypothetical protein